MTSALPMTPARRGVLAIGVPIVLALIGFTGFNLVADIGQASYPVSYSIPVSAGHISLGTSGGDLTVRPSGTSTTGRLTGTVHYSLERPNLAVNKTASGTDVSFQCRLTFGNCNLDAALAIPASNALSLSSSGGNLSASGITGDVSMSTGGGDVTVTGLPGHLRLNTSGGNINVVLPHGSTRYNLHTSTAGGNISDGTVPVDSLSPNVITATTGGGDITVTEAS
jgi:hypothetical protein